MNASNIKNLTLVIFAIGFLIIVIFYYNLSSVHKNIINFISLFGTFLSLFGIIFAFLQLESLKQINKNTQTQVNLSIEKINDILSISELSKSIKVIQEIQNYLHNQKSELSLVRLKDLKQILIQIKHNNNLTEFTNQEDYEKFIVNLSIDINNISDSILKPSRSVNFSKINSNLEELSTRLSEFENKLKFN
jgi:hypothetical protein